MGYRCLFDYLRGVRSGNHAKIKKTEEEGEEVESVSSEDKKEERWRKTRGGERVESEEGTNREVKSKGKGEEMVKIKMA
jgi:hypothetical protein